MRNRLNVVFQGRRTTARFPDYLWRLALFGADFDDEALASYVRRLLQLCDITDRSASEVVQGLLVNLIELRLASVGFNPDNSRAQDLIMPPQLKAAEARPSIDD